MENKGFTVIEMIVALGIFSVLLVATMGAFANGYASQRRILEMQAVQRDGAYLMEIMSREIRMASSSDGLKPNLDKGSSRLDFTNHDGKSITYCRASIKKGVVQCSGSGKLFAMINDAGVRSLMNSSNVEITNLTFYSSNTDNSGNYDKSEPIVTISMTLQSAKDNNIQMTLQTSVAMRLYSAHPI